MVDWLIWAFEWLKWAFGATSLILSVMIAVLLAWIALRHGTPVIWRWLSTNTFTHVVGYCFGSALVLGAVAAVVFGAIWLIEQIHLWAILIFVVLIGIWETVANRARKNP